MDPVTIKYYNNIDSGCLIIPCYFRNTYSSRISNLVLYGAGNNILNGVNFIQSGINLQYIPTHSSIISEWKISAYNKKKCIGQVID